MNLRPHPALTLALATALAGTHPIPAAADDDTDVPMVQHCYTEALTDEEVAAGAVSVLDCYDVPEGTPMEIPYARLTTIVFSIVYDVDDTTGSATMITGTSCTGGNVVFGSGDPWDNRISAIKLVSCGAGKHWSNDNFTGSSQLKTGTGTVQYITGTMNNQTSSIEYAP